MTCSSCVGTITHALQQHKWVTNIDVSLISNSVVVDFDDKDNILQIQATIEDVGYEATLKELLQVNTASGGKQRKLAIRVDGMYCAHCPSRIHNIHEKPFISTQL